MATEPTASEISRAAKLLARRAGLASAARLTPEQRRERAAKAGRANKGKPRKSKVSAK